MSKTFQITTTDHLQLSGEYQIPDKELKGSVIILHGMGEHYGRYKHVSEYFCSIGYATIGMDHRGHGKSEGKRGHTPSYEQLMRDIDVLFKKAKELFDGLPVILYGHSMGGNLAANYVIRRQPDIKALILTDPYFKLAFDPPAWKVALGKISAGILPTLTQPTGLETEALSRDQSVVEAYKNDPLVHDKITSSFFVNVHTAGPYAIDHADKINIKTLVMHGTADRLTSIEGTRMFAQNNPALITLKIWDGLYHEIHNEPEKQQVFDFISQWLSAS